MTAPQTQLTVQVPTAAAMIKLGAGLGRILRAGDLVLLSGPLGAGKTTLVQGLAAGLGVQGKIISPTFVIARVHPSLSDGPALVHVDAYRLGGVAELDDLDLDTDLDASVVAVEWGAGLAEVLAVDRLVLEIARPDDSDQRELTIVAIGASWTERSSSLAESIGRPPT